MKFKTLFLTAMVLAFSANAVIAQDVVNVGNKICPISGEKTDEMGEPFIVEYEGKAYNLCCAMCAKDFKKDPAKYIQKVNEELEAEGDTAQE